jgi:transcriptional regulator with XRE-family HTH domain
VKHNKDNDYLKALGANIRLIRKSKSITMEELANEAEIEYRQLGRIERGEINTSVLSLLKLSECLGVDIADLFKF